MVARSRVVDSVANPRLLTRIGFTDIDAYLRRIGYAGPREPTLATLRGMHRAHFYHVPFENLDILARRRIEVDGAVNFAKVVNERRGGFCLELSGLFARVLRELGFVVDVLGGRVMGDGKLSEPLSHMTLLVHLEEPWIADVGFGGRIGMPLRLAERQPQEFESRQYVVANDGDHWFVTCSEPGSPAGMYTFTLQPRAFDEFHEVCTWLQTSPDSRFTQGAIASLATDTGRRTLAGDRLITTNGSVRDERIVASDDERTSILREQFGLVVAV